MHVMNSLSTITDFPALAAACIAIFVALIIILPIYFALGTKGLKRIFAPCKECHFIPGCATWTSPADGSLHQVQECERCGQKRDVVLSAKNLEAAQKFFFGQQQP